MAKKPSLSLLAAVLLLFGAFSSALSAATPGTWSATADFGTFELTVNAGGNGIESVSYSFSSWTCGSVIISGGIGVSPGTPWPINNGQFSFTHGLNGPDQITISGSFTTSSAASGTFSATISSTDCDGTWTATNDSGGGGGGPGGDFDFMPTIDHGYVQGAYVHPPGAFPGWGFIVDTQEHVFFCAIFGYLEGTASFLTLQGSRTSEDPLEYMGNVIYSSNGGTSHSDVGDFLWRVGDHNGAPAALLTMTSNLVNVTDLGLIRFSYVEEDPLDVVTGGNWNIIRRQGDDTDSDVYFIDDNRFTDEGTTYVGVSILGDDDIGIMGHFTEPEGSFYAILVEDGQNDFIFYVFLANNTGMFGEYWILQGDEEPSGPGMHFRGSADGLQQTNAVGGPIKDSQMKKSGQVLEASSVGSVFERLKRALN